MSESKKQTFNEIIHGDKPVLVDFHAEWCGPCKMMAPVIQQLSTELGNRVRILKIDIDKNPKAAATYQVQAVPTFIIFKSGRILWRQAGAVPAHILKQQIELHS